MTKEVVGLRLVFAYSANCTLQVSLLSGVIARVRRCRGALACLMGMIGITRTISIRSSTSGVVYLKFEK